jgi:hypothetical protein
MVTIDVSCFLIGVLLLSVNVFLSALMYTTVTLYHGDDYSEMVFRILLVIIAELVIRNVMRMEVYDAERLGVYVCAYCAVAVELRSSRQYRMLQR